MCVCVFYSSQHSSASYSSTRYVFTNYYDDAHATLSSTVLKMYETLYGFDF